jgi:hypothetical protein
MIADEDGGGYSISNLAWSPANMDGMFTYGTAYTVTLTLTADTGFAFAAGVTATVNAEGAQCTLTGGVLTVSYTFAPTENEPIKSVAVSNLPPKAGDTPDLSADTGAAGYSATRVLWTPAVSDRFIGNEVYTAEISLSADTGYVFDLEGVAATVNGNARTRCSTTAS